MDGIALLTIFVLAVFVGFEVVSKVSSTLHTPLMSGANAIHGIILVGAILVAGHAEHRVHAGVALLAVVLATMNLVGGFVVTDRMLEMFKGRAKPAVTQGSRKDGGRVSLLIRPGPSLAYLVAAVCFILALKGLSSPQHRPPRQPDRCLRRPGRRGHGVPVHGPRQPDRDPRRDRRRLGAGRPASRSGEDDPDAAAGGAVQRRRRWRGRAGGAARARRGRRRRPGIPSRRGVHGAGRRGVVLRLGRHVPQAAGADDHPPGAAARPALADDRLAASPRCCWQAC